MFKGNWEYIRKVFLCMLLFAYKVFFCKIGLLEDAFTSKMFSKWFALGGKYLKFILYALEQSYPIQFKVTSFKPTAITNINESSVPLTTVT